MPANRARKGARIQARPLTSARGSCLLQDFLSHCWTHWSTEKTTGNCRAPGFVPLECFCYTTATILFVCNVTRVLRVPQCGEIPALKGMVQTLRMGQFGSSSLWRARLGWFLACSYLPTRQLFRFLSLLKTSHLS
jgi:hypothetical protein